MNPYYNIDVNITKRCTMNCDYCFAMKPGHTEHLESTLETIDFLHKFLESDFFKKNYEGLVLNLWGGEPTMRMDHITDICNEFEYDQRVRFFIFTNGYKNTPLKGLLLHYQAKRVGNHPKLSVQVSYDGEPIHDIKRRSGSVLTSDTVRNFILWCDANQINFVIKSTVTPDTFKYMYQSYQDIYSLHKECKNGTSYINYFPTIDYYTSESATLEDHLRYMKELENSLSDIATIEIENINGPAFFAWFNKSMAKCSAGKHSAAIDVNGEIYACHGCMYTDDKTNPHRITYITDPDWESKFKSTVFQTQEYDKLKMKGPETCDKCPVEYCLRCNFVKFENSLKELYLDKWFDFPNQPYLCDYYKINNIVKKAMLSVGGKKNGVRRTL